MTRRRIILMLAACFLVVFFAAQTFSQARRSRVSPRTSDAERQRKTNAIQPQREAVENREARRLELEGKQRLKALEEKSAEIRREFLHEKHALCAAGLTEEQWKLVKLKLERIRDLREKARSTVNVSLTSSSTRDKKSGDAQSQSVPTWQWYISWKDKASNEQTEAQQLAAQIVSLVEHKNATPEQFRRTMDSLRKARLEEAKLERQLAEAREELRKGLTIRQEAALVLMGWL